MVSQLAPLTSFFQLVFGFQFMKPVLYAFGNLTSKEVLAPDCKGQDCAIPLNVLQKANGWIFFVNVFIQILLSQRKYLFLLMLLICLFSKQVMLNMLNMMLDSYHIVFKAEEANLKKLNIAGCSSSLGSFQRVHHPDYNNELTQFLPRTIVLKKPPGAQLGFNIRGGKASQLGIFISKVRAQPWLLMWVFFFLLCC